MEDFDQTELPAWILLSPIVMKKVGCPRSRSCWVDGGWHALAVDHLEVNSARLPNIHSSPKTPSWVRAPCFQPTWPTCERRQMPQQKEPWQCWSQPTPSNTGVSGRRGSRGAAKIPGDGRLWQWPSGEFIKDDGLVCGCCLPKDMNVIRAQLKGQSCSMKCHWSLRGSNVPFRLMPHPPFSHIRVANKCWQSFVVPSQNKLKRIHFGFKSQIWKLLN